MDNVFLVFSPFLQNMEISLMNFRINCATAWIIITSFISTLKEQFLRSILFEHINPSFSKRPRWNHILCFCLLWYMLLLFRKVIYRWFSLLNCFRFAEIKRFRLHICLSLKTKLLISHFKCFFWFLVRLLNN